MSQKYTKHHDLGRRVRCKAVGKKCEFDGWIESVWRSGHDYYHVYDDAGMGWHRTKGDILIWYPK